MGDLRADDYSQADQDQAGANQGAIDRIYSVASMLVIIRELVVFHSPD